MLVLADGKPLPIKEPAWLSNNAAEYRFNRCVECLKNYYRYTDLASRQGRWLLRHNGTHGQEMKHAESMDCADQWEQYLRAESGNLKFILDTWEEERRREFLSDHGLTDDFVLGFDEVIPQSQWAGIAPF